MSDLLLIPLTWVLMSTARGLITGAVFLDLSKAFDTVDHGLLLGKLKQIGACDNVVGWFRSYLNNRFQLTAVGDVQSPLAEIDPSRRSSRKHPRPCLVLGLYQRSSHLLGTL